MLLTALTSHSRIPTTFPAIDSKVKMVKFIWKSPNKPKLILGVVAQLLGGMVAGFLLNASVSSLSNRNMAFYRLVQEL